MEKYQVKRTILCIDLKSFYASVECVLNNLDPFKAPLVVADIKRGNGSIVLAISPYLKNLGLKSRTRLYELPKDIDYIYARPQMAKYIEYSTKVINVYLKFVSHLDLYVYSIDEAFLDVTNYLDYYKLSASELALKILEAIKLELGLYAACGIGPNMLISKFALDIEAKKNENFIAKWDYSDLKSKFWPVDDLQKMWGIGYKTKEKLNRMGINNVGDLANYNVNILKNKFGIIGEELYYHAHGIDSSLVSDQFKITKRSKSIGVGQVLFSDYNKKTITTIIYEMTDELVRKLVMSKQKTKTISLSILYSNDLGGFSRQKTLEIPSYNLGELYYELMNLFDDYYENLPIRRVSLSFSNLVISKVKHFNLFDNEEKDLKVTEVINDITNKYGAATIVKGSSKLEHATAIKRSKQIGGHHV